METKVKKNYTKPTLMSEVFVPQEYVAVCAVEPGYTKYSFICNAGLGVTYNGNKYVWNVYDDNGNKLTKRGLYGPCDDSHILKVPEGTSVAAVFTKGYMDNFYTKDVNEHINVYIWKGENNNNVHCMTNPGVEHIAVPKNMS